MGANKEITRVKSRCTACSVGCGVEFVVRDNRVIRVDGDWDAEPNKGLICEIGRFDLLYDKRQRVRKPLVKVNGKWQEADWEEACDRVAAGLKAAKGKVAAVASGFATTEGAQALAAMPGEKMLLDGAAPAGGQTSLAALDEADIYIVVKADLTVNYQVASFALKRGIRHRGARLLLVDDAENGLADWAAKTYAEADAMQAVEIAKDAQQPVVIYDAAGEALATKLAKALPNAVAIGFTAGGNTRGLVGAGIEAAFTANGAKAYYVLAAEAAEVDGAVLQALGAADFVAVQASFLEPWADVADVILPTPIMFEKSGSITSATGAQASMAVAVSTKRPSEVEVLQAVTGRL